MFSNHIIQNSETAFFTATISDNNLLDFIVSMSLGQDISTPGQFAARTLRQQNVSLKQRRFVCIKRFKKTL